MSKDPSSDRLIKNEKLIKAKNIAYGKGIKKYLSGDKQLKNAPIAFICECSKLDCDEHVSTSIECYNRLHESKSHFTIFRGHDNKKIEKVVARQDDFDVVEKPALSS